jgi:hypothetical protein
VFQVPLSALAGDTQWGAPPPFRFWRVGSWAQRSQWPRPGAQRRPGAGGAAQPGGDFHWAAAQCAQTMGGRRLIAARRPPGRPPAASSPRPRGLPARRGRRKGRWGGSRSDTRGRAREDKGGMCAPGSPETGRRWGPRSAVPGLLFAARTSTRAEQEINTSCGGSSTHRQTNRGTVRRPRRLRGGPGSGPHPQPCTQVLFVFTPPLVALLYR